MNYEVIVTQNPRGIVKRTIIRELPIGASVDTKVIIPNTPIGITAWREVWDTVGILEANIEFGNFGKFFELNLSNYRKPTYWQTRLANFRIGETIPPLPPTDVLDTLENLFPAEKAKLDTVTRQFEQDAGMSLLSAVRAEREAMS